MNQDPDRLPARSTRGAHPGRFIVMATLYLAISLTILVLAYTSNLPAFVGRVPYFDKLGHGVLYALAVYFGHRALVYRTINGRRWLPGFPILFFVFTLTEELVQHWSPNRTLDRVDLIASSIGIVMGWWLAEWQKRCGR
jgi:hypothetical protein